MKAINVTICDCGKYIDDKAWKKYVNLEEVIISKVKALFPSAKVDVPILDLPDSREKKELTVKVLVKEKEFGQKVYLKLSKCNLCDKEGTNYFEAILQIRSKSASVLQKSIDYIQHRITGLKKRGLFVNKIDKFDDGFDLWLTSQKLAQTIGRELVDHFGGEIKASPRLFTRNHQTSKKVYRVNVYVELPGFTRGDVLIANDNVCLVEKLGKKIKLLELATGASYFIDHSKLDYTATQKEQTYVSKIYPTLEVINPHDFQSSVVKNKVKPTLLVGQTVQVVIHRGIFVVA